MSDEKKITRKVISKTQVPVKETKTVEAQTEELQKTTRSKKACFFCQSKTNPMYTDIVVLRRFVTDRAKIISKTKTNTCSKHQREVTRQIKYARHLALLPFTPKI